VTALHRHVVILTGILVVAALFVSGCTQKVQVKTGERITCSYGEAVTDTVRTIEVLADQANRYHVTERTIVCDRHRALEARYASAQQALVAGDLAQARRILTGVVADEPLFRKAAAQLADLTAGRKPKPDTASPPAGGSSDGGSGKEPVGPVAGLARFVPDSLAGYRADPIEADVYTLTRSYTPASGSDVEVAVIAVEQYKSASAAEQAIARTVAPDYPVGTSSMTVNGRTLYFGTDGSRFAVVSWHEAGVLVAVEASSRARTPSGLKNALVSIARAIAK
jgi:hypothetical protein